MISSFRILTFLNFMQSWQIEEIFKNLEFCTFLLRKKVMILFQFEVTKIKLKELKTYYNRFILLFVEKLTFMLNSPTCPIIFMIFSCCSHLRKYHWIISNSTSHVIPVSKLRHWRPSIILGWTWFLSCQAIIVPTSIEFMKRLKYLCYTICYNSHIMVLANKKYFKP